MAYKRISRRIGALLLTAAMLLSASSCGFIIINDLSAQNETEVKDEQPENADKPKETTRSYTKYTNPENGRELSQKYLDGLPKRDYDGAVFFITTPSADYISPTDAETSVERLAVERNAWVSDLLNISLITSVETADNMLTSLRQSVAADSYYTDLLMMPIYMIGQFREYEEEETLINLRSLPFFDIDQPYFNKESSDMTSGGYSTYGVAGDASISPASFSAVFMNKSVLESAGVDTSELYDLAEDGKWTLDELLECTAAVAELNANGADGMEYYTLTAQDTASRLPDLLFKAAGNDFIRTGTRRSPVVGFNVKSAQKTLDRIAQIYNDPKAITDGSAGALNCFMGGESAFIVDYLSVMPKITNVQADWGILPLPKQDEGDSYRTLIANTELVFGVPSNHTNGEFAAITLSAINAASCGYIYDEYVEYSMLNLLRDNDSVNMLDMILDTASFDFAMAFGNAYPKIADATYKLVRSTAKSNDLADKFTDLMTEANAEMSREFDLRY